jgi:hypothetical protein
MKKLLALGAMTTLLSLLSGCATVEDNLQKSNALLLSAKEVRTLFQGNTVTSSGGDTFYWDSSGTVTGKGSYGGTVKGNWNVTDDGRLCISNWNSSYAPSGCYKVYFDNTTQQNRLVDSNGELKWAVINVVTGNPQNF